MIKLSSFVLIAALLATSPAFAQDPPRSLSQQVQNAEAVQPLHLLPPQSPAATGSTKPSSGTSHKKRNIVIVVVAGAVVAGVAIAAHNGAYGGSGTNGTAGY